jgi:hypothetical protein
MVLSQFWNGIGGGGGGGGATPAQVSIQDIDTFVREYLNTAGSQLDSDSRAEVRDTSGNQRVFVVSSSQESQIASITGFSEC